MDKNRRILYWNWKNQKDIQNRQFNDYIIWFTENNREECLYIPFNSSTERDRILQNIQNIVKEERMFHII